MVSHKKYKNYLCLSLWSEFTSSKIYLILLLVFIFIWSSFSGVTQWLHDNNDVLNVFELYIFMGTNVFTQSLYLIGILIMSCGRFFFDTGAVYYLIRMDKKTWVISQVIYMFVMVVIFNILLILMFIPICGFRITIDGSWSNAAFAGCSAGAMFVNIVDIISMSFPGLLAYNPNFVGILSFFLLVVEGVTVGVLMMIFTMKKKPYYAIAIVFGGQFLDLAICNELGANSFIYKIWGHIAPFNMYKIASSSLNGGSIPIIYIVIYVVVILYVLVGMLIRLTSTFDVS